jgi:hypothetical protein
MLKAHGFDNWPELVRHVYKKGIKKRGEKSILSFWN